jgi:anti-sigma regulatory factor (Ser/Thr protein kinase)
MVSNVPQFLHSGLLPVYLRGNEVVRHADYNAELRIPGDLIYLRPVRSFIKELAMNMDFSHQRASDIELAVDEVFSNAVEHGSAGSKSQIIICCFFSEEIMEIKISDAGPGKGPNTKWISAWSNAVEEKVQPGTERGHGLLLVHQLIDNMSIGPNSFGGIDVHLVIYKERQPARKI